MKLIQLFEVFQDVGDAPSSTQDWDRGVEFDLGPAKWRGVFQGNNFGVWTNAGHLGLKGPELQRQVIQGFKQIAAWLIKAMQEGRTPDEFYFIPASDSRAKLFSRMLDRIGEVPGWSVEPFEHGPFSGYKMFKATTETVGSNDGEKNAESGMGPVAHGDEEGNAQWDWTDPYHSSGSTNAVLSNTP